MRGDREETLSCEFRFFGGRSVGGTKTLEHPHRPGSRLACLTGLLLPVLLLAVPSRAEAGLESKIRRWMTDLSAALEEYHSLPNRPQRLDGTDLPFTLRALAEPPSPWFPVHGGDFKRPDGIALIHGYCVILYGADRLPEPWAAPKTWVAYAWPQVRGETGFNAYMIWSGDPQLVGCPVAPFSGPHDPPPVNAAFETDPFLDSGRLGPSWVEPWLLKDRDPNWKTWEQVALLILVFGGIVLATVVAGYVLERRSRIEAPRLRFSPAGRSLAAAVLIGLVFTVSVTNLFDMWSCRMYSAGPPLLPRAAVTLVAFGLSLSEALGRRSLPGFFGAVVAFLLLGLDGNYLVRGHLVPGALWCIVLCLLYGAYMFFATALLLRHVGHRPRTPRWARRARKEDETP